MTCSTYMMVCIKHKHKCLWRGRLMSLLCSVVTCSIYCLYHALLSQDDDLHPHETLIVQSYEISDSPWITVIQTLFEGLLPIFTIFTNHVTITLWDSVVRLVCYYLCLCEREGLSNFSSLLCDCITTLGGRHCIVGFWVNRPLVVVRDTPCH